MRRAPLDDPWTLDDADARRWLLRRTAALWVWMAALFALWSMATPLWSSPDEPAHDLMAYAVGHGQLLPEDSRDPALGAYSINEVPRGLVDSAASVGCYAFQPTVSASCMAPVGDDETPTDYLNPAGRYFPVYYGAIGWPSSLVPQELVVPAERLVALALSSLFVAWAAAAALACRRPGIALAGLGAACSPMVMYLGGVVNPNSLEITASLAMGACSLTMVRAPSWLGHALYRRAMVAAAMVSALRLVSPVWTVVWAVALVVLFSRPQLARVVRGRRKWWLALPVGSVLLNGTWAVLFQSATVEASAVGNSGLLESWQLAKSRIDEGSLQHMVGGFGWLDTGLSYGLYFSYLFAVVVVVATAWLLLERRQALVVVGLVAATYLVPIAIQAVQWNEFGPVWQGRYTLPLAVLVVVAATFLAAEQAAALHAPLLGRVRAAYVGALSVFAYAHVSAYVTQLRRNASGTEGSMFDGSWSPVLGVIPCLLLMLVLVGVSYAALLVVCRRGFLSPIDETAESASVAT